MLTKYCPQCKKLYTPDLSLIPGFDKKYERWQRGELIQWVWPEATDDEREQLQTGICSPDCWEAFVGIPDDE